MEHKLTPELCTYLQGMGNKVSLHLSKCNEHNQTELLICVMDIPESSIKQVLDDIVNLAKVKES